MIKPDTIIALKKDQYRIIKKIGSGAYGVVWQAERISDGEMVAVKTVQTRNPENRSPFSKIMERRAGRFMACCGGWRFESSKRSGKPG